MKKEVYMVEVGQLYPKYTDGLESYENFWDKEYAYYDENEAFFIDKSKAFLFAHQFIDDSPAHPYCVISKDIVNLTDEQLAEIEQIGVFFEPEAYDFFNTNNLIYSCHKDCFENKTYDNFVKGNYEN